MPAPISLVPGGIGHRFAVHCDLLLLIVLFCIRERAMKPKVIRISKGNGSIRSENCALMVDGLFRKDEITI